MGPDTVAPATIIRSLLLFLLTALAEIGGAWLVWQGWREHRGTIWIAGGLLALGGYGFVATFQPDPQPRAHPRRRRGAFVAGSLARAAAGDHYRPDRYDLLDAGF